jgi:hypothetical protein
MTAKIGLFAAAPSLMKDWQRTSVALASAANFDSTLTELVSFVPFESRAAPIASI